MEVPAVSRLRNSSSVRARDDRTVGCPAAGRMDCRMEEVRDDCMTMDCTHSAYEEEDDAEVAAHYDLYLLQRIALETAVDNPLEGSYLASLARGMMVPTAVLQKSRENRHPGAKRAATPLCTEAKRARSCGGRGGGPLQAAHVQQVFGQGSQAPEQWGSHRRFG